VERVFVDVYKDRLSANVTYRLGGREEAEGSRDDFVAWFDSYRPETDDKCVCTTVDTDGVLDTQKCADLILECCDLRSENELAALHHSFERSTQLDPQFIDLGAEIENWDLR